MSSHGRPERGRVRLWHRLWSPFWVLPAVVAVFSTLLGVFLPQFDERLADWMPAFITSGPDGARQLLGAIAGAMISITGLVFSITMVVLQLASNQFTPRLLGQFLQSRTVQLTLGVFTGSFLYALAVLRSVRGAGGDPEAFVPQVSVTLGFLYVLAAVALLVMFIQHVTKSVQVSHVVGDLGHRTRVSAHKICGARPHTRTWSPRPGTPHVEIVHDGHHGMITGIDSTALVRWAAEHDCVVTLHLALGEFIVAGQRIGTVWMEDGDVGKLTDAPLHRFIDVAAERELAGDYAFGVLQLTDIADRALSPGVNDPTTAIQVTNELYAILRPLAEQLDPSPYLLDDDGVVRATYRTVTFGHLVQNSLLDIAHYAQESPRVLQRLREVTESLHAAAVPAHRPVLERALARMEGAAADVTGPAAEERPATKRRSLADHMRHHADRPPTTR